MKVPLKKTLSFYFNSLWLPAVVFLVLLAVFTALAVLTTILAINWQTIIIIGDLLLICLGVAFAGILSASIWNLIRKRWVKGAMNFVMLPVCGIVAFVALFLTMFVSMLGPSEDGFANNLTIPEDINIAEPTEEIPAAPGAPEDAFQAELLNTLELDGNYDTSITADISSLVTLHQKNPDILRRYLATSPSWRVFEDERGIFPKKGTFATRRWMIGSKWRYHLHGYYTKHDIDIWSEAGIEDFQSRFTIGFSGIPWARRNRYTTRLQVGDTTEVYLSKGNGMHESHCVITANDLVVEIFEQSEAMERRLTKTAINYIFQEFQSLAENPNWTTIKELIPPGSIRNGEPSFELQNSFQPGIYDSEIWLNPGESGMVHLKAFEVTKETILSEYELKDYSNEWIGWSDNSEELFLSNTHFTIFEGDWGKPYAARFEVWFVPDSGEAERKLMEKVFRIEGWQR